MSTWLILPSLLLVCPHNDRSFSCVAKAKFPGEPFPLCLQGGSQCGYIACISLLNPRRHVGAKPQTFPLLSLNTGQPLKFSYEATPNATGFFEVTVNGALVHSKKGGQVRMEL